MCRGHFELYRYLVTFCIHVLQEWPSFLSIPGTGAAPDTHLGGTEGTGVRPSTQSPLTRSGHTGSPCPLRCREAEVSASAASRADQGVDTAAADHTQETDSSPGGARGRENVPGVALL